MHDILLGRSNDASLSYGRFNGIFAVKVLLLNFINQNFTKVHTLKGQRSKDQIWVTKAIVSSFPHRLELLCFVLTNFTALAAAAVMGVVLAPTGPL